MVINSAARQAQTPSPSDQGEGGLSLEALEALELERLESDERDSILDAEALSELEAAEGEITTTDLFKALKVDPGNSTLQQGLMEHFQPLVEGLAYKLKGKLPNAVDVYDLIQDGQFGLLDAIRKFDPDRGIKFATYSARRILGSMQDGLRYTDWAPRLVRARAKLLDEVAETHRKATGEQISDEVASQQLGITVDELIAIRMDNAQSNLVSIGEKQYETDSHKDVERKEFLADPKAEAKRHTDRLSEAVHGLMSKLPHETAEMFHAFLYEGQTMREIGEAHGLSESRVSQMFTETLAWIAEAIEQASSGSMGNIFRVLREEYGRANLALVSEQFGLSNDEREAIDAANELARVRYELSSSDEDLDLSPESEAATEEALRAIANRETLKRPDATERADNPFGFTFAEEPDEELS